jgi:lysyl-tRNA synthetase class I
MDGFDEIFGGRFRDRYRSPVAAVCTECGFSDAKGSAYSSETDMMVSGCHNPECSTGFMETLLSESEKGVYYLVDPVRDPCRDVAVHVFGGDYRDAGKGQKTSKVEKVKRITKLACGETPKYFLAPMIGDEDGKPLSKSHGTGMTVDEIDDLERVSRNLVEKVREWMNEENEYIVQDKIIRGG